MSSRRPRGESSKDAARVSRERIRDALVRAGIVLDEGITDLEIGDQMLLHYRGDWDEDYLASAAVLQLPSAEVESRAVIYRESYFLDAQKIAEAAVSCATLEARLGRFASLGQTAIDRVRRAVHFAAQTHLVDREFSIMPAPTARGNDYEKQRLAHEIAVLANFEDVLVRRILWRTWIDRLDLRSAARAVGVPLESVERELMRLGLRAHDALGRGAEYRAWLARRPPDGARSRGDQDTGGTLEEGTQ